MARVGRWVAYAFGVVLLLLSVPAGLLGYTFYGMAPLVDGTVLAGGVVTIKDGHSAVYLVPIAGQRVVLIDGGMDPEAAAIRKALAAHGYAESDVAAILLTHGHPDHTAACARFSDARVYAGRAELDLLAGRVASRGPMPRLFGASPSPCSSPTAVDDGAAVELEGELFHAYAIPGHTAGSTAWIVQGVLFLGDAANAGRSGQMSAAPWVFSDDVAQDERSLRALHARLTEDGAAVSALAFAHSGALTGVSAFDRFARGE